MQHDPNLVLGIDAAWTDKEPSGIALLEKQRGRWRCRKVGPSYAAFCGDLRWDDKHSGKVTDVSAVLETCLGIGGAWPRVIAVDMPLAHKKIDKRRYADNEVSKRFGHCKCGVHSPNMERPGITGERLHKGFENNGYRLVTQTGGYLGLALIEVYPHVALLGLANQGTRLEYKVGKTKTYWKNSSLEERKQKLIAEWKRILEYANRYIDDIAMALPENVETLSLKYLKRYEDSIDALVCAWVAIQFIEDTAQPIGDRQAAIWIPEASMKYAKEKDEKK